MSQGIFSITLSVVSGGSTTPRSRTLSFVPPANSSPIRALRWKWDPKRIRLRASLADPNPNSAFPLASRIIVKNLGYYVCEKSLHKEFSIFGEVAQVKLVKNEAARGSKAYAFIQYTSQDAALLALENMDRQVFDGRLIFVEIAKPRKEHFGGYPRASGPPKNLQNVELQLHQQDEVVDCWY